MSDAQKHIPGLGKSFKLDAKDFATSVILPAQADSAAATVAALVTDFNALLAKLRAAGLMK